MNPARAIRKRYCLTLDQMASIFRVGRRTVQNWESGKVPVERSAAVIYDQLSEGDLPDRLFP